MSHHILRQIPSPFWFIDSIANAKCGGINHYKLLLFGENDLVHQVAHTVPTVKMVKSTLGALQYK